MNIVIMIPFFHRQDAMSADVLNQYEILCKSSNTSNCYIYAEQQENFLDNFIINKEKLEHILSSSTLIIYHHGVYWSQGEEILKNTKNPFILRYHSITPDKFYKNYDKSSEYACKMGVEQTNRLMQLKNLNRILATSIFTSSDLPNNFIKNILPPLINYDNFLKASYNPLTKVKLRSNKINILFVGRIVPNKGIHHLINVIDTFIEKYHGQIIIHLTGSFGLESNAYYKELETIVNQKKLSDYIIFHKKVSFEKLHTLYRFSNIFLIMSEHEGFCIPIIEAQYHHLPIIVLDRTAIGETAGENQIKIKELDYNLFAAAIHEITIDDNYRNFLILNGQKNYKRYEFHKIAFEFEMFISNTILELEHKNSHFFEQEACL